MKRPQLIEAAKNGCIDIQFSTDEIKELLVLLQFAISAAKMMSNNEMVNGTYKNAAKMGVYMQNAARLLEIVVAAAQIGSIPHDVVN